MQVRREGNVILIEAGGRTIRSDTCWSRNPTIKRVANSQSAGIWTTSCATPPNDPREEHGQYVLKVLPNGQLLYQDVSRYDWRLQNSKCAATATTTQALTRVGPTATAAPTAPAPGAHPPKAGTAPTPAAKPVPVCVPGAPTKLALRPTRADIELGERVCFKATATDAANCALPESAIRWSLEHDAAIKGRLEAACFVAGAQAAEAEGEFRVVAAVAALRAEGVITVRTPDLSSLLARRIETGALQGEVAPTPAPAPPSPPKRAAKVAAQAPPPVAEEGKVARDAVAWGGLAVALGAGVWLALRRRRSPKQAVKDAIRASERPPASMPAAGSPSGAPAEPWICPTCRVGYPRTAGKCPKDGTALVPYKQFAESRRSLQPDPSRRCPRCGKVYPDNAAFCSEDGTPLG